MTIESTRYEMRWCATCDDVVPPAGGTLDLGAKGL